jgi:hypothetical protein
LRRIDLLLHTTQGATEKNDEERTPGVPAA